MGYLHYNTVDKSGSGSQNQKYPDWRNASPNLKTFLDALNLTQPISSCQYELRMSRWPRTIFFAKNISIPGINVNILEISHAGFKIPIASHPKYDNTEISFNVIADKEGYHYYDFRAMAFQTGHPLVAGDTMSTVGYQTEDTEDTLDIRVRNKTDDPIHHHWKIHNFRVTQVGEMQLSHDSSGFLEFSVSGTFTHIDYDCGVEDPVEIESEFPQSNPPKFEIPTNTASYPQDEDDEEDEDYGESPGFGDSTDEQPSQSDNDDINEESKSQARENNPAYRF